MYTYNISKRLCEILNTEFNEHPSISDQLLCEVPQHEITSSRGTRQPNVDGELNPMFGRKKRPEHSALMKKYYQEGRINPPTSGRYKVGHKRSKEILQKIGERSGAARLGQKRGSYDIVNSHKNEHLTPEIRKLIGQKSGASRLGKKRGPYKKHNNA